MASPDPLAIVKRQAGAARRALDRRDAAIVEAREAGHSLRTIAEAAGLTHPAILKIIDRSNPDA